MSGRVLVTGVADRLGGEVARRLEDLAQVEAIIGVDLREPVVPLVRTEFVHADTRHSVLAKMVRELQVDTVVHCAVTVSSPGSARAVHETDVIGTMNVLAACAGESSPVNRLVVKSSVAIYGAAPDDPSFMREEMGERASGRSPLARDLLEMEQMVEEFGIRNPAVTTTVLRLGHRFATRDQGPLARYFALPSVPTTFGFDPRLQFLHEEDAVEALLRSALADHNGVYNVAGDGIVLLSQAIHMAGRRQVQVLPPYGRAAGRLALKLLTGVELPAHVADFLVYGQVVDCSRLQAEFGWRPGYDTRSAMMDFVRRSREEAAEEPVSPPQERELQLYIQRRRRRAQLPAHERAREASN
jgi:UDP-glucose 4-epimerase